MPTQRRLKPTAVHVVVDTNALFTERADKLLSPRISAFIADGTKASGNEIIWHLPSMVRNERHYQMLQAGLKLAPSVKKMETLLGIDLQIDAEKLNPRISEAIGRQITEHCLKLVELDPHRVDWPALIENAVFRRPPFSEGNEKGFKDAIILEIFMQVVESLPKTGCRIVLLSDDVNLGSAARARSNTMGHVLVVTSLEELENTLNAIASHLSDEQIAELEKKATSLFFIAEDKNTLFYKLNVNELVNSAISEAGVHEISGGKRALTNKLIGQAAFVSKISQRVTFRTRVSQSFSDTLFDLKIQPLGDLGSGISPGANGLPDWFSTRLGSPQTAQMGDIFGISKSPTGITVKAGFLRCQVIWEAIVLRTGALSAAKIVGASFESIAWKEPQENTPNIGSG